MDAGASRIATGARARARVKSGFMKSEIQAEPAGTLTAVVRAGADYTAVHEFGTARIPPQPMLGPAAAEEAERLPRELANAITSAARKS